MGFRVSAFTETEKKTFARIATFLQLGSFLTLVTVSLLKPLPHSSKKVGYLACLLVLSLPCYQFEQCPGNDKLPLPSL